MSNYKTEQEVFWSDSFGDDYIERNQSPELLASNINFFVKALSSAGKINSCKEFGANIGMNIKALKSLYPSIKVEAIEINKKASAQLSKLIGHENVFIGSIFDAPIINKAELVLIKTVLIHINPDMLNVVYEKLYETSSKYILIAEYYNPTPITIDYRGNKDKLFKRDFAGDFLKKYPSTKLIDYGFSYKRDPSFPQDDITWFLIEK